MFNIIVKGLFLILFLVYVKVWFSLFCDFWIIILINLFLLVVCIFFNKDNLFFEVNLFFKLLLILKYLVIFFFFLLIIKIILLILDVRVLLIRRLINGVFRIGKSFLWIIFVNGKNLVF